MTDHWQDKRVLVTGGAGFLGSFLCERLTEAGAEVLAPRSTDPEGHGAGYDLRSPVAIRRMLHYAGRVDALFHLAATVGGIGLNREHPGLLFYENALMGIQLIELARQHNVAKFVQVGTVCAYPRLAYKLREECLWDGYPDPTNAPYGLAKKMLLVQLQAYRYEYGFNGIYLLPTNLYGPRDNFDPRTSHVIPALIRKCVQAQETGAETITAWGSGTASRDFLYVEDAAAGLMLAAERYDGPEPINLGSGREIRIDTLLHYIQQATGYQGRVVWDTSQPDGQPRRVLDTSRARDLLGWQAETGIADGLARTVDWYKENRP